MCSTIPVGFHHKNIQTLSDSNYKERWASIPCGHWKDAGTFPPPMQRSWTSVSWWTGIRPLSQSLWTLKREREECSGGGWSAVWGVGRVECCELGVGSHVGHGKVNSSCYHNSNCFDNSETTAASMATMWLCVTWGVIYLQCRYTNLHQSRLKRSCLHGNGSIIHT